MNSASSDAAEIVLLLVGLFVEIAFFRILLRGRDLMPTRHQLSRHPKHVSAIGMIALETVDLEIELSILFARMLQIAPKVGEAILLSPKSEQARLDIFRNAAKALFEPRKNSRPDSVRALQKVEAKKKVLDLLNRAQKAFTYRHRTMHDEWTVDGEKEINRMQVDGALERKPEPVPIERLNQQIKTLRILIDDITALAKQFHKKPPRMVSMKRT